ncbi:FkbM family methyltransferase [Paraburkholderia sp.]|uniref:FkbM family methyltransferase n=1 Tax=Paraburkholderia sp. TaxID=1926495 RepID=UPI0025ED67CA|nr:FkbM family methyltransferase [Paraburkholderia sp.]
MGVISYAQNFEDVILWRALGHVERGFYVDIGAQHPVLDSISKAFYEKGWRGVHVEPTSFYAGLLREDRPDEVVIEAVIGDQRGLVTFFEIPDTGLSTASVQIAEDHRQQGRILREMKVPSLTLDDLFQSVAGEVHWLKIDVEGFEREVLAGWRESPTRPWVMVVESTYPCSQRETHETWEALVLAKGYTFVYVDGLNRYYVSDHHPELAGAFRFGPNVFDGFRLPESSWAVGDVRACYEERLNAFARQKEEVERQMADRERALRSEAEERLEALRTEGQEEVRRLSEQGQAVVKELALVQREAQQAAAEERRRFLELDEALRTELAASRETAASAAAMAAECEQALRKEAEQRLDAVHSEARAHLQQLLERENTFVERLAQVQCDAQRVMVEQAHADERREQALQGELAQIRNALVRVETAAAERERAFRREAVERLDAARSEARTHTQQLLERENAFAERLMRVQSEVQQILTEQVRAGEAREQALRSELVELRGEIVRTEAAAAECENKERFDAERRLDAARADGLEQVRRLVEREREFSTELAAQKESHRNEIAELDGDIATARDVETTLRAELAQQIERVVIISEQITRMRQTYSWRLTEPLRWLAERRLGRQPSAAADPVDIEMTVVTPPVAVASTGQQPSGNPDNPEHGAGDRHSISQVEPVITKTSEHNHIWQEGAMTPIQHVDQILELHDTEFLDAVYQILLGRAPDEEGGRYYLGRLRAGYGKATVIMQIGRSDEARAHNSNLRGLRKLIKEQREANHWFWGIFSRGRRLETQVNRLEYELGQVARQLRNIREAGGAHRDPVEHPIRVIHTSHDNHTTEARRQTVVVSPAAEPATSDIANLTPRTRHMLMQLRQAETHHIVKQENKERAI